MCRINHKARFGGNGRQMIKGTQAHFPCGMQISGGSVNGHERLTRSHPLTTVGGKNNLASQLARYAFHNFRTG